MKVPASSTHPTCKGRCVHRSIQRLLTVLPPALLGSKRKPHDNREDTNSSKHCLDVPSLESAAKAAATLHGTGKGCLIAGRQRVRLPKEELQRLLTASLNPTGNPLCGWPLGDRASTPTSKHPGRPGSGGSVGTPCGSPSTGGCFHLSSPAYAGSRRRKGSKNLHTEFSFPPFHAVN